MPPQILFDITGVDFNRPTLSKEGIPLDREGIRKVIPHRGPIEQLDAVVYLDIGIGRAVAYRDVRSDEFWVGGHIPGRPLLPGVLMLEMGAQLCSVFMVQYPGWEGFLGFGGVDNCRFRQQVVPGQRLTVLMQRLTIRHGRFVGHCQGLVNGSMAFEADIIGLKL